MRETAIAQWRSTPVESRDPIKKIDGLTHDQPFFLSFALVWPVKNSDEDDADAHQCRPALTRNVPCRRAIIKYTMYRDEKDKVGVW